VQLTGWLTLVACGGFSVLLLQGCGGGKGGSSAQGAAQRVQIGDAAITYVGTPRGTSGGGATSSSGGGSSSSSVTVVGLYGATITNMTLAPANSITNTSLAFLGSTSTLAMVPATTGFAASYAGNAASLVLTSPEALSGVPTFTRDGRIVFSRMDPVSGVNQLYACYYDGSSLTQLTTGSAHSHQDPSVSSNNTVAYDGGNGTIYTMPLPPVGVTVPGVETPTGITTGSQPTWSIDGKTLAFTTQSGAINKAMITETDGGTTLSGSYTGCTTPNWSPDGTKLTFVGQLASNTYVVTVDPVNPSQTSSFMVAANSNPEPCFTADSKLIAYQTSQTLTTIPASNVDSIVAAAPDGTYLVDVFEPGSMTTGGSPSVGMVSSGPACSYYLSPETFIGQGSPQIASAAGFLWMQVSGVFASMTSFNTSSPASATIVLEGSSAGTVYDLSSNGTGVVTSLAWTNSYYPSAQSMTTMPNVTDVYVSYNTTTGQVATVAPLIRTGAARASVRTTSGSTVLAGRFTGVWNAQRTNLTPQGASQITLDSKTGALISFEP
jgi:hypothetical protein